MLTSLPLLLLLSPTIGASLLSAPRVGGGLRFRGGADDGAPKDVADDSALTDEQITAKLNEIPVFVLMGAGGGFVALEIKDEGRAVPFFLEPEEAQAVLNMTLASHPDDGIRLVSVGLGNALKLCTEKSEVEGFDGHLRLQGSSRMTSEVAPKLKAMLAAAGMEEGSTWQLPVFLCEELGMGDILPIFFNPREIRTAWELNGLEGDKFPDKLVMMDLRMMVADMKKGGNSMPWGKIAFIGAKGAAEFANELLAAREATPA